MSFRTFALLPQIIDFPDGSVVKNQPEVKETQETWVQSPGQDGSLEEEMATHSQYSCLGIPWTEEPGWLQSMGSQKSQT